MFTEKVGLGINVENLQKHHTEISPLYYMMRLARSRYLWYNLVVRV